MKITNAITPLRVSEDEEEQGLDLSQHDESIYTELELAQNLAFQNQNQPEHQSKNEKQIKPITTI